MPNTATAALISANSDLNGNEQHTDLFDQDGQHDHQTCQCRHHCLIFPPGADQQLVQHGNNDANGRNFEDKSISIRVLSF